MLIPTLDCLLPQHGCCWQVNNGSEMQARAIKDTETPETSESLFSSKTPELCCSYSARKSAKQ